jgi:hypothetical protein
VWYAAAMTSQCDRQAFALQHDGQCQDGIRAFSQLALEVGDTANRCHGDSRQSGCQRILKCPLLDRRVQEHQ